MPQGAPFTSHSEIWGSTMPQSALLRATLRFGVNNASECSFYKPLSDLGEYNASECSFYEPLSDLGVNNVSDLGVNNASKCSFYEPF